MDGGGGEGGFTAGPLPTISPTRSTTSVTRPRRSTFMPLQLPRGSEARPHVFPSTRTHSVTASLDKASRSESSVPWTSARECVVSGDGGNTTGGRGGWVWGGGAPSFNPRQRRLGYTPALCTMHLPGNGHASATRVFPDESAAFHRFEPLQNWCECRRPRALRSLATSARVGTRRRSRARAVRRDLAATPGARSPRKAPVHRCF